MENIITILNIDEFSQDNINGNLVLTRLIPFIDEASVFKKNLLKSSIIECKLNGINLNLYKYKKLLIYIYYMMDINTIIENSVINVSREEIHDRGYKFYRDLGLSVQGNDARHTLKEIINIVKINKFSLELKIDNGHEIIRFMI